MPNLLQLAVFALEFSDLVRFTWPPPVVQQRLFGLLAPLAELLGYAGNYPEYLARRPEGYDPSSRRMASRSGRLPAPSLIETT